MAALGVVIAFDDDAERAIEVDPRSVSPAYVSALPQTGINRVSIGIQSFHPLVHQTIRRIAGVNLDLMYASAVALPDSAQRAEQFEAALRRISAAGYLRIGLDHFAKADDELALKAAQSGVRRTSKAIPPTMPAPWSDWARRRSRAARRAMRRTHRPSPITGRQSYAVISPRRAASLSRRQTGCALM